MTLGARLGRAAYLAACGLVFVFLLAPLLVIVPLSFNAEPYFTFTEGMLRLDAEAFSLRWYRQVAGDPVWQRALANSLLIGTAATTLATALGTLAAMGLTSRAMPARRLAMGLLISPMVAPLVISAAGMFFFYSALGLAQTHLGLILAHAALGTPFVVITVTATLSAFDRNLSRAAAGLGAGPWVTFRRVELPIIAPASSRARSSPLPPPSTRWWWCCSWPARRSGRSRARCGPECASRSAPRSWPWLHFSSASPCCYCGRWNGCAAAPGPTRTTRLAGTRAAHPVGPRQLFPVTGQRMSRATLTSPATGMRADSETCRSATRRDECTCCASHAPTSTATFSSDTPATPGGEHR